MRVEIQTIKEREAERVVIECVSVTPEVEQIRSYALAKGTELSGTEGERLYRFPLEDVLYFEAVDERLFACTEDKTYELKGRLYEMERAYEEYHFLRCSKSVVINLMALESISPALNGRFYAHMQGGERLMISRQYVPALKERVIGGGKHEK